MRTLLFTLISLILLNWSDLYSQKPRILDSLTGDGETIQTAIIQKVIDECRSDGGGTIVFTKGRFLCGPLFLCSNLTIQLDSGAVLIADNNPSSYFINGKKVNFMNGNSISNLTIRGRGTIDGNGKDWWDAFIASGKKLDRPRLIYLTKSKNLTFEGITLLNSPSFHLVPQDCEDVIIKNMHFIAPDNSPNTDAIDPSRSKNVTISGCTLDVGDDNVAIKAGRSNGKLGAPAENILIENCTCLHGHGISIGSETSNGVKNVIVHNCSFQGTTNGIRIKSNITLGGPIENLNYSDITMVGVKYPILITFEYKDNVKDSITTDIPVVKGFNISRLKAVSCIYAGKMIGLENSYLQNINLEDVQIEAEKSFIIENANNVNLKNVKVTVSKGESFVTKNVQGVGF